MNIIKFLLTASREANALVVVAIAVLLLKILFLNRYPAQFLGAYELGVIVEAVLASVVASYVFYLLVVHAKEFSDREFLRPYVEMHSKMLIRACTTQITDIEKASSVDLNFYTMTESEIFSAMSKINPYSEAPLIISVQTMQHANWFQYFNYHKLKSNESTRKLLVQLPFLEAQIVSDLTAIDDCTHFSVLDLLASFGASNKDLSALSHSFFEYCQLCKQLESNLTRIGLSPAQ
ncbi:hypothetical protein CLU80_5235 [Pseudomonas sp. 29]|uniref:hypothetical protein n=1 Tax=Pseudomonas sp. 29 TaxID=2035197 RepID=UPI000C189625|nr:hypothetical protein [Pseudomonas sp. 29]PIF52750.1 hypothetical protein CLU80_5235 [Pseudomonas sp. 29]